MSDAERLTCVPLFAQLQADALEELAAHLRPRRLGAGAVVFYRGDPGTSLCVIEEGRVKLALTSADGREVVIDLLGPGAVFGELALLDGHARSADAVTVEPTRLLLLDRDEFIRFLLARPQVAVQLLGILAGRLRRDAQLLEDAAFLDVPARLARTLLRLAEPGADGIARTPRLRQSDLAGLAGTTRETLNKWLGFYHDQGLIRREQGRIAVLQPEGLRGRIM